MDSAENFLGCVDKLLEHFKDDFWPSEFQERYLRKLEELRLKYQQIQAEELPLKVAFLGEYSVGKSSIINTILGENFLPTHDLPSTKVVTILRYSDEHRTEIEYKDGSRLPVEPEKLKNVSHRTEIYKEDLQIDDICRIHVYYPCPMLSRIQIVDTPGLKTSTNPEDDQKTIEALIEVDVVIWVFDANTPIKDDIKEVIRHFQELDLPMIGILNKADTKSGEELEELLLKVKETYKLKEVFCYSASKVLEIRTIHQKLNQLWLKNLTRLFQCESVNFSTCIQEKIGKFRNKKVKHEMLIKIGNEKIIFSCDTFKEWDDQYKKLIYHLEKFRQNILKFQLESIEREFRGMVEDILKDLECFKDSAQNDSQNISKAQKILLNTFKELDQNISDYIKTKASEEFKNIYKIYNFTKRNFNFDYKGILSLEIILKFKYDEYTIFRPSYRRFLLEEIRNSLFKTLQKIKENIIKKIEKILSKTVNDLNLPVNFEKKIKEFHNNFYLLSNHWTQILSRYNINVFFLLLIYLEKQSLGNLLTKLSKIYNENFGLSKEDIDNIDTTLNLDNSFEYFLKALDCLIEEEYLIYLLREIFKKLLLSLKSNFESCLEEKSKYIEKFSEKISIFERDCLDILEKLTRSSNNERNISHESY